MSEEKKPRTKEQIQAEYGQLCARSGQAQYQIYTLERDLDMLNSALRDLNLEVATLKEEPKQAPTEQPAEPVKTEEG